MIVSEIIGGLGNQLFQYAHAQCLANKLDQDLNFDLSFFDNYYKKDVYRLDKFCTDIKVAKPQIIKKIKRRIVKPDILRRTFRKIGVSPYYNKKYHFTNNRIDVDYNSLRKYENIFVSGYFADQKYFLDIDKQIKKHFILKNKLNHDNNRILEKINNMNSVSIHFRRGDYVQNDYFINLSKVYYYNALNYLNSRFEDLTYFVFSDDLNWVKNNIKINSNLIFVDVNCSRTDYMELKLMSSCQHNIIANSTFSWWAAWLNNYEDKVVIVPSNWYNDQIQQKKYSEGTFIPTNWKRIDCK